MVWREGYQYNVMALSQPGRLACVLATKRILRLSILDQRYWFYLNYKICKMLFKPRGVDCKMAML
jgi:hypothetical protein